jgi:hypothetical protein
VRLASIPAEFGVLAEFEPGNKHLRGGDTRQTRESGTGRHEYAALRAELSAVRGRSYAIFGGVLALSGIALWQWLGLVQASMEMHAHVLALVLAYVVASAMALTYKDYAASFRIAAYLEVFHEGPAGWEGRRRGIRDFIFNRRGTSPRRSLANVLEPRLLAWLYLPLVMMAPLLLLASPLTTVRAWNVAPTVLALGVGTYLFLELGFYLGSSRAFWRWWWAEYARLEGTEPEAQAEGPEALPSRYDPATTMMALLALEFVVLFLFGVAA